MSQVTGPLYRRGPRTIRNLTPRPGRDTVAAPGRPPGLSVYDSQGGSGKVQVIDPQRLRAPLAAIPDDPSQGGAPGHFAITPVDESGQPDQALLEDWAAHREDDTPHVLTTVILNAIIREERIR